MPEAGWRRTGRRRRRSSSCTPHTGVGWCGSRSCCCATRAWPRRSCRTPSSPCTAAGVGCATRTRRWPTCGRRVVNRSRSALRHLGVVERHAPGRRPRPPAPGADHAPYDVGAARRRPRRAARAAHPPARGARAAPLPRPVRDRDRRDARDQPGRGQEPRLPRRRRPPGRSRRDPPGGPMNDDDRSGGCSRTPSPTSSRKTASPRSVPPCTPTHRWYPCPAPVPGATPPSEWPPPSP